MAPDGTDGTALRRPVPSPPAKGGLTPAQARAAAHDGPILVLAGAGTGKTKTLTAAAGWRIDALKIPASRVLAVTFTNKAAGEMRGRIRAMLSGASAPYWLDTFHGLGARQLRHEPEVAQLRHGFDILDAADARRLVKRSMAALGLDTQPGAEKDAYSPKAVFKDIGHLKDMLVTSEQVAAYMAAQIAAAGINGQPTIDAAGAMTTSCIYVEYQRRLTWLRSHVRAGRLTRAKQF